MGTKAGMIAALIAAVREADDGAGLVATLPVAGRTLLERQVRIARAAGADHVVVLVERITGDLTAAVDRLRRGGVQVDVARSAGDGADRFHPDERVLLFADGALAPVAPVTRMAAADAPVLLTLGEDGAAGAFERIDAATRWAGVALLSGATLRRTAAMLGDWDLTSTLLREAAGGGARRVDVADGAGLGEPAAAFLVRTRAGARAAAAERPAEPGGGWVSRLLAPLVRVAAAALVERPVEAGWLRWAAVAAALAAAAAASRGWLPAALGLAILSAIGDRTGALLAAIRLAPPEVPDRPALARGAALAAMLLAYALHRFDHGYTPAALALATIGAGAALAREAGLLALAGGRAPVWIAEPDALVLMLAAAAAAGEPIAGVAALAAYAFVSFGAVQDRLVRLARR